MIKILIVEDEGNVRRVYAELLKNEGFEVFEAEDAIRATEILTNKNIDIALLDIRLPRVYGSMLFDIMQKFHKKVKVIVASVYSVDEQKLIIKDAADYYDKSQGLDLLLEKIKKVERSIKQQKNILVIDDESRIRKIYRHYLQEHGYRIIEAHDGSAGLDILRKNNEIALVILDLAMPEKSGFEIYETIKKEFPNIKILIASVFPKNDQKFFLPDADEYYGKSEDPASLIKKIEKLIDLNSSL